MEPPIGSTDRTVPIVLSLGTASIDATVNPAAANATRASVKESPTRSNGTVVSPGPSLMVMVTTEPFFTLEVASGSWDATRLIGIVESCARFTTTLNALS